ncbi:ankyrin repeat-containing domain protein [Aspergillus venezuelensis]
MNPTNSRFGPALHAAARVGHEDVIRQLLLVPRIDVYNKGSRYGSALQAAVVGGNLAIVKILLEADADINAQNGTYETPLIAASRRSHYYFVEVLLERGAAVDVQVGVYGTALQAAARSGNRENVRLLLDHHADPNLIAGEYATPLQVAARDEYDEILGFLLSRGANPSIEGGAFGAALQAAAGADHLSSVKLLVKHGAESGKQSNHDARTLIKEHWSSLLQCAAAQGHKSTVEVLLGGVTDSLAPSIKKPKARFGHLDVVALFLQHGVVRHDLSSALTFAVKGNHEAVVRCLLEHGARAHHNSFEESCKLGDDSLAKLLLKNRTPGARELLSAAFHGHDDIVRLLLVGGFDVNAVELDPRLSLYREYYLDPGSTFFAEEHGVTALHCAICGGHAAVVNRLLQHNANITLRGNYSCAVLQVAAAQGLIRIVNRLIGRGADVNLVSGRYGTALQPAALGGWNEVVKALLHFQDINVNQRGGEYRTALQAAAAGGHETIVRQLIAAGANVQVEGGRPLAPHGPDPDSPFYSRWATLATIWDKNQTRSQCGKYGTSLQAAAESGNLEIVRLLLDNGADTSDIDICAQTPLHRAACHGHEAVVSLLLERGASAQDEDKSGRSSFLMAASNG